MWKTRNERRVRLIVTDVHMYSDDRGDKEHAALGPHAVSDNGVPSQGMRTLAGFIEIDANRRVVRVVEQAHGTPRDKGPERGGARRKPDTMCFVSAAIGVVVLRKYLQKFEGTEK